MTNCNIWVSDQDLLSAPQIDAQPVDPTVPARSQVQPKPRNPDMFAPAGVRDVSLRIGSHHRRLGTLGAGRGSTALTMCLKLEVPVASATEARTGARLTLRGHGLAVGSDRSASKGLQKSGLRTALLRGRRRLINQGCEA